MKAISFEWDEKKNASNKKNMVLVLKRDKQYLSMRMLC